MDAKLKNELREFFKEFWPKFWASPEGIARKAQLECENPRTCKCGKHWDADREHEERCRELGLPLIQFVMSK